MAKKEFVVDKSKEKWNLDNWKEINRLLEKGWKDTKMIKITSDGEEPAWIIILEKKKSKK